MFLMPMIVVAEEIPIFQAGIGSALADLPASKMSVKSAHLDRSLMECPGKVVLIIGPSVNAMSPQMRALLRRAAKQIMGIVVLGGYIQNQFSMLPFSTTILPRTVSEPALRAAVNHLLGEVEAPLLSSRQEQVLRLVISGLSNHQIAATLGVSEKTIRNSLVAVYKKMGVKSRTQAIHSALRLHPLQAAAQ